MIKGIRSSKVRGREYFVGETVSHLDYLLGTTKNKIKKIWITTHRFEDTSWVSKKEVFIVEFENGYTLSAPFEDYEMIYTTEEVE